jgi:hypothetical protein
MLMNRKTYMLVLIALACIVSSMHVHAQLPLLTRQLHVQHNGNGRVVQILAPTLDSTYTLTLPNAQGAAGSVLSNNGSGGLSWVSLLNSATINGTTNYLTKYTSTTGLGTSIIFDNGTTLGIGTTSPAGRLQLNTSSATEKGLIIRGAASATANLMEVQDGSGSQLLTIGSNGDLSTIRSVSYNWPTSKPATAATGTELGGGVLEVSSSGTMSWRQMAVTTATLNFPVTATRNSSDLTFTVTGAATGDAVTLGVPNAAVLANSCYTAWVSGANTVTVRFNNYDNADKDPASAVFKVMVFK